MLFLLYYNVIVLKNNELYTDLFLDYLLKVITRNFTGKVKRELERQIEEFLGSRKLVLATTFYHALQALELDIDKTSEKFFKNHMFTLINLRPETDNRLRDFLAPHILGVKNVSVATNIEYTRLSRLLSGEFSHLYPNEVYGLAKAFSLNPSTLFEYFYGDGPRPVVGL